MRDAIIVLAHLMDEFGNLNNETRSRLSTAYDLLMTGEAPFIVPCGWAYREDSNICIADAMATHAERIMGIPEGMIITETASRDTVGDAVFTKRNLANPRNWRNIVVVTSAYHAERTREIFSFVYGWPVPVVPAPSDDTPESRAAEARSVAAFRRTFAGISPGDDAAIFERLATRHPFYNGDVYPAL